MVQDIMVGEGGTTRRMVKVGTGTQKPATGEQKAAGKAAVALKEPTVNASGWDETHSPEEDAAMISTWKDTVFAASAHAPRFRVEAGEALIVDNYRALHIREAYRDMDRFSWRVWMWVEGQCHGPPDDVMRGVNHYIARGAA